MDRLEFDMKSVQVVNKLVDFVKKKNGKKKFFVLSIRNFLTAGAGGRKNRQAFIYLNETAKNFANNVLVVD